MKKQQNSLGPRKEMSWKNLSGRKKLQTWIKIEGRFAANHSPQKLNRELETVDLWALQSRFKREAPSYTWTTHHMSSPSLTFLYDLMCHELS